MRYIWRELFFNGISEFIIQHIALTYGYNKLFMKEFRDYTAQFVNQHVKFFAVVNAITESGTEVPDCVQYDAGNDVLNPYLPMHPQ